MIYLFDWFVGLCNHLIRLLADEKVANILGAPFIFVLIAFFAVWVITNIFIIRPFAGSLFFDKGVRVSLSSKESKTDD